MNRSERLFAIAEDLRHAHGRQRTTSQLAEAFEVSQRTIKRDMAALYASGVPLVAVEGRGGGYQMLRETHLSPVPLTAGEAAAVVIALASQPQMPYNTEGRSALAKMYAAMSPDQRAMADDAASRVWMRTDASSKRPPNAAVLDDALRRKVAVTIAYADADGNESRRLIEPMAFARTGGHWYCLAWCHLRGDGRWFRLDRVRRAWPTTTPCAPRDLTEVFGEPPPDAMPATRVLST
ncbi:MAG: WYL domain-containing protein [Demequinaceae bacterium]|nr:WYL domain-containing protein [Demequinaceae bacterium]